jgi:hypothetical protein
MSYIKLEVRDNVVFCEITYKVNEILSDDNFPLYFQVLTIDNSKIIESIQMEIGTWRTYCKGFRDVNFRVVNKNDVVLRELIYDYQKENQPLYLYEFWDYFTKLNKNLTGVVLGAGNGLWGEWVKGVLDNNIKCFLIEGSKKLFKDLKSSHGNSKNFTLINELISIDGADYDFYDHGGGYNSININYIKNCGEILNDFQIEKRKTKEINLLLNEIGNFDWLRFDLEGIDYELIMSLNLENISKLKMIQYEHLDLDIEKRTNVENKFKSLGYKIIVFGIDTVFIK